MSMTGDPIPGRFVLNMLLMEYVGHGWDLARALGSNTTHSANEVDMALQAAMAIIEPKYRGHGMFGEVVDVEPTASPIERFVAFLGRNPRWQPA